jgi:flavin reductase (DIM6/NTAB) family NADH-FMN oxidoreductase RutF
LKPQPAHQTIAYNTHYFPLHLAFLTVGENMMPIAHWMVISKDPFRFLIAMQLGNHSLTLLRKFQEAALHFMPWKDRESVVRAGYMSGNFTNKAERLGFTLIPAQELQHTKLVAGADIVFETKLFQELPGISHEFAPFVMDVVAMQGDLEPTHRQPILFMREYEFSTTGEGWRFQR